MKELLRAKMRKDGEEVVKQSRPATKLDESQQPVEEDEKFSLFVRKVKSKAGAGGWLNECNGLSFSVDSRNAYDLDSDKSNNS
jgi:hypothetical protein